MVMAKKGLGTKVNNIWEHYALTIITISATIIMGLATWKLIDIGRWVYEQLVHVLG